MYVLLTFRPDTLLCNYLARCLYKADNGDDAVGICGTGSNRTYASLLSVL